MGSATPGCSQVSSGVDFESIESLLQGYLTTVKSNQETFVGKSKGNRSAEVWPSGAEAEVNCCSRILSSEGNSEFLSTCWLSIARFASPRFCRRYQGSGHLSVSPQGFNSIG